MKKIILLLIAIQSYSCFAQKDCEYNTNVTDSIGTYKSTNEFIIYERTFGNSQTALFFSLINAEGLPSLKVQLIEKSTDFISAKCFDKNSKLYFQLNDGKVITLIAVDNEICGESLQNEKVSNRVLTGYFLFMKDTFESLKNSPISLLRIKYGIETIDYIMKSELVSEIDKKTYTPENYFIDYLKCILN